jgi:acyl carrier protein
MDPQMVSDVIEFIRDEYLEDDSVEITEDTPLISSGIVDSFSMVSLKMYLEENYDIKMGDDEASTETFDTVRSICSMVEAIRARG